MSQLGPPKHLSKFELYSKELLDLFNGRLFFQHQIDAVLRAQECLNVSRNGIALVVLPTGCGKTGVAVLAAYALAAHRVLVVTPSVTISEQIGEAFGDQYNSFLVKRNVVPREQHMEFLPATTIIRTARDFQSSFNFEVTVVNAHKIGNDQNTRPSVSIADIPHDMYDLVIVDEAHHYPADTWRLLVDHFADSMRLFLTATPYYRGEQIFYISPGTDKKEIIPTCYGLTRDDAVSRGIIRPTDFEEVECDRDEEIFTNISLQIIHYLNRHDQQHPNGKPHKAMVLAQTKEGINPAFLFQTRYQQVTGEGCGVYVSGANKATVLTDFNNDNFRTLVVCGSLREGYDNSQVSVVAIVRNVRSRVLFAQFIGRAVRKFHLDDPVHAVVLSHPKFNQRQNYDLFDNEIGDEENEDEENEDE